MFDWAKKVAGTYVTDDANQLAATLAWVTEECRSGRFAEGAAKFCLEQPEFLDPKLALVEQVSSGCIQGRIPARHFDHETDKTFPVEVKFNLNPRTGEFLRTN
jgi:hypothetical protein